jgi:hypothetical protein
MGRMGHLAQIQGQSDECTFWLVCRVLKMCDAFASILSDLQRASGVSPEDPFAGEALDGPAGRMHGSTLMSCRTSPLGESSVLVG